MAGGHIHPHYRGEIRTEEIKRVPTRHCGFESIFHSSVVSASASSTLLVLVTDSGSANGLSLTGLDTFVGEMDREWLSGTAAWGIFSGFGIAVPTVF